MKVENREHFINNEMVKRIGNIYSKICTAKNIAEADNKARIGKTGSSLYIRIHDENRKAEDMALLESLILGTYKTSDYDNKIIYEPKERIISKLPYYPDRICHHAIMNIAKPLIVKQLVNWTYANIEGRGIHACISKINKILKVTKQTEDTKYYLKIDIRKFYPNISHDILKDILTRKFKDKEFLNLIFEIIDSYEYNGEYKYTKDVSGLPLGNYLSGYLCNLYLNPLDRFIKEELKIKYVYRYADDILIFGNNKEYLHKILIVIKLFVKEVLHLEVKPNYYVAPVDKRPIDFIGYVITHNCIKVRKSIKIRFKKAIDKYNNKEITHAKFIRIFSAYYGWLTHADCRYLLVQTYNSIMNNRYKSKETIEIINKILTKQERLKAKEEAKRRKKKAKVKHHIRRSIATVN